MTGGKANVRQGNGSRRSKGREQRGVSKALRVGVLVTGLVAAAILVSIGITASRREPSGPQQSTAADRSEGARQGGPGGPESTESSRGDRPSLDGFKLEGDAALLIEPKDIASGFAPIDVGSQTLDDLLARLPEDQRGAERARLEGIGFEAAAIATYYKPEPAPPPLNDAAVTIQILKFKDPKGAQSQLAHDAGGALAKGFGVPDPVSVNANWLPDLSSIDPAKAAQVSGGVLVSRDPTEQTRVSPTGAYHRIAAVAATQFEIVIWARSTNPIPQEELGKIIALQIEKALG